MVDPQAVKSYLMDLQDRICQAVEEREAGQRFHQDIFPRGEGVSRTRVFSDGEIIERGGVNFTHTVGAALPEAATKRRPELAGKTFEAVSLSLILHPRNPYAPTTHANWRCFVAGQGDERAWWFGGGFDLTPYYGFDEDCVHWHQTARNACDPFGKELYPRFKEACDHYFFLAHRQEPRGIGGVFYDDFAAGDFAHCFALTRSIADHFTDAYMPILDRRHATTYGDNERQFQLYRRGRYVEFNLIYDRGTRFGLQAGGRAESILVSMPPKVRWDYDWQPQPGSAEERLYERYLQPRDWANQPAAEKKRES